MTPYPSHSHYSAKRSRRASSVGPGGMGFVGIVGDLLLKHIQHTIELRLPWLRRYAKRFSSLPF
jgi:hypothetical protein